MAYAYNSKIYLAEAVLNVKDLARQTAFYTQVLGLEILSQSDQNVLLGAGESPWCTYFKHHEMRMLRSLMAFTIWRFYCRLARN